MPSINKSKDENRAVLVELGFDPLDLNMSFDELLDLFNVDFLNGREGQIEKGYKKLCAKYDLNKFPNVNKKQKAAIKNEVDILTGLKNQLAKKFSEEQATLKKLKRQTPKDQSQPNQSNPATAEIKKTGITIDPSLEMNEDGKLLKKWSYSYSPVIQPSGFGGCWSYSDSDGKKTDVNQKDEFGRTVLHLACLRRNINEVTSLIAAGASVDLADKVGNFPIDYLFFKAEKTLHEGCRVPAMLEPDLQPDASIICPILSVLFPEVDSNAVFAKMRFLKAAEQGNIAYVNQYMLENRDNAVALNLRDQSGSTALINATYFGHLKVVEVLLRNSLVNVNVVNKFGLTALNYAKQKRGLEGDQLLRLLKFYQSQSNPSFYPKPNETKINKVPITKNVVPKCSIS